ncbi:MAG: sigma-70 family RNA polymerase sigma factor [Clostridia bacterium]|nr:sigma-70 family RNA polymerase sigma factor [Clostridia bacterium]
MPIERSPFPRVQRRLTRASRLEEEIAGHQAHILALRAQCRAADPAMIAGRSGPSDRTAFAAVRVAELEQEIAVLRDRQRRAEEETRRLLARLPSARSRALLEMRYLSGLPWEQISEALDITPRAALMRHRRALEQLQRFVENSGE